MMSESERRSRADLSEVMFQEERQLRSIAREHEGTNAILKNILRVMTSRREATEDEPEQLIGPLQMHQVLALLSQR